MINEMSEPWKYYDNNWNYFQDESEGMKLTAFEKLFEMAHFLVAAGLCDTDKMDELFALLRDQHMGPFLAWLDNTSKSYRDRSLKLDLNAYTEWELSEICNGVLEKITECLYVLIKTGALTIEKTKSLLVSLTSQSKILTTKGGRGMQAFIQYLEALC